MSLYRKSSKQSNSNGADDAADLIQEHGVKRSRETLRQQTPQTQPRSVPPPPKSRFQVYDDSDELASESEQEYGVVRNQLSEDQRFDALGNELFYEDPAKYQNQGIVVTLRVSHRGSRTKTMKIRFATPHGAPEHFIIPDIEVKEGKDSSLTIDPEIREGDFVYFDARRYRWLRDYEKSEILAEERKALEIAQGRVKVKRVTLNTERMLLPIGIPSLFYEVPNLCQDQFRSAAISGVYERGKKISISGSQKLITATHTSSPNALSIDNCLHNLNTIIGGVYLWKQQLLPKVQTNEFLKRVIALGSDRSILNEMDKFMSLTYDNDIAPRVRARDERLEKRHEYLDEKRKKEQNPHILLEKRQKEREQRRLEQKNLENLSNVKQQYMALKKTREAQQIEEDEFRRQKKLLKAEEKQKKRENSKSSGFVVDDDADDGDLWSSDVDLDEAQNQVSSTPSKNPPKQRLQQYSSRLSSKFYEDDSDDEISINIGPKKGHSTTASPKSISSSSTAPTIKKVVYDSDSEEEYFNMSRQKRADDMNTRIINDQTQQLVSKPKKSIIFDSDDDDDIDDDTTHSLSSLNDNNQLDSLNSLSTNDPTQDHVLRTSTMTAEFDDDNLFN